MKGEAKLWNSEVGVVQTRSDDSAEFEAEREKNSLALGRDNSVFDHATSALTAADQYRYAYLWSWWGLPIIQLPADIMATQEVIFAAKPTVIIETGVARGGSLIFLASMLQLLGRGKVIGIDIDIRAHNRQRIEQHPLSHRIELIEGPSTDPAVVGRVEQMLSPDDDVMVVLDSDHSRKHVLDELTAYGPMVTAGQYMVVADTLLGRLDVDQTPTERSRVWHRGDEPLSAVNDFLAISGRFQPDAALNGKLIFSSSPGGYLKCMA